jgi:aspartate/tyrosine/aromatic aminotransferase
MKQLANKYFGTYSQTFAPDGILGLMTAFTADVRPEKLNLAIGYLYGEDGQIFIPAAVEEASRRAPRIQEGYLVPSGPLDWNGNRLFMEGAARLVFGKYAPSLLAENRIAAATTVGGTQAVSLFAHSVAKTQLGQGKTPTIIMGNPPYPNHPVICQAKGLNVVFYPQLTSTGEFNQAALLTAINSADSSNIFLLQGTAHNPTGINARTEHEWRTMARAIKPSGAAVFLDIPYAGLDGSMADDTAPVRIFLEEQVPLAVAFSFSKIAGLYGERVGMLMIVTPDEQYARDTTRLLNGLIREVNSSPAGWGQRIMAEVFNDPKLLAQWLEKDLPAIAQALQDRRVALAAALPAEISSFIRDGVGLFAVLPIKPEGAVYLRDQHAIYVVPNGPEQLRVNIGGGNVKQMAVAGKAISAAYKLYHA